MLVFAKTLEGQTSAANQSTGIAPKTRETKTDLSSITFSLKPSRVQRRCPGLAATIGQFVAVVGTGAKIPIRESFFGPWPAVLTGKGEECDPPFPPCRVLSGWRRPAERRTPEHEPNRSSMKRTALLASAESLQLTSHFTRSTARGIQSSVSTAGPPLRKRLLTGGVSR